MMKLFRKNNKGFALLSVIIAMTVVAVLGVSILYVTYSNFNMKMVDKKSKDNFYTAEKIVDEIVAEIENRMSICYEAAYTTIMERYGSYSSASEMQSDFKTEYILNLVDYLHQTYIAQTGTTDAVDEDVNKYSIAVLSSLVTGTYNGTWGLSYDGTNTLETQSDGVVIRNLKVTFTSSDGYVDSITTDIRITVPGVEFVRISSMTDISDYSYIANKGIEVAGNVTATVTGKAYSGSSTASDPAIELKAGSKLNASGMSLLVAGGEISPVGSSTFTTGADTDLWAQGIDADVSDSSTTTAGNTITIAGRSYISDDITLSGSGNSLIIKNEYYGYSSGSTAAESSAIIINGRNTSIDMSDTDVLVLAGTAYVSGSSVNGQSVTGDTTNPNSDILTGESIAVKTNQLGYLVPTDCEGISCNPMSYAQYQKLSATKDWINTALSTKLSALGRSIKSYGSVTVTPVFSPTQGGTVYLYLDFTNTSEASAYFMDMYGSDSTTGKKLRQFLNNYMSFSGIESPDFTRLITNGNYLVPGTYSSSTSKWTAELESATYSSGAIANELSGYASTYVALCTKLVESSSGLTTEEIGNTVFANIINKSKIQEFFTNGYCTNGAAFTAATGSATSGTGRYVTFTGENGLKVIIVKGNYQVGVAGGKGIIIAIDDGNGTGNVTVNGNWEGTIICEGELKINTSATLKANSGINSQALRLNCDICDASGTVSKNADGTDINYAVMNFFKGGEDYSAEGTIDYSGTTDVRNCVTYENWKSE